MHFTQATLLAALAALTSAAPIVNSDTHFVKRANPNIPDNVPAPPAGQCALLVYSATILPLGGVPTSVSGEGIAPSEQGEPEALVINQHKDVVSDAVAMKPQSPGFATDIKLDGSKINNAGTVHATADYIAAGATDWNVDWTYNGKSYTCNGDKCNHYNEYPGGLGAYSVHVGHFPC